MAAKKGPLSLTEAGFIEEVTNRSGVPRADVTKVVRALKEEALDCLVNGYKVTLSGFLTLTPEAKAGRKKGTKVRNPFDGTEKTLRADEPDKFKVKAKASPTLAKQFPSTKTAAGQALLKQLAKPKAKKGK